MKQQCFKNKKWGVGMKFSKLKKASVCFLTFCLMAQSFAGGFTTYAQEDAGVVIDATDYGADPTGEEDSAQAIWTAFEAAKEASENGTKSVTVSFPKGEYHIYKDYAQTSRLLHPEPVSICHSSKGKKPFLLEAESVCAVSCPCWGTAVVLGTLVFSGSLSVYKNM